MSNMLNRFVKIIEQVDPEEQQQQREREGSSSSTSSNHHQSSSQERHENKQESTAININNNNDDEENQNNNTGSENHQDEITDYDISDPFVAEYIHQNKKQSHQVSSPPPQVPPPPQSSTNATALSPYVYSSISAQHNYDKAVDDTSSHYQNYVNRSGSFDLTGAVASSDVKALLERIAALESAIVQSNYERQVLQCRLEKEENEITNAVRHDTTNSATHNDDKNNQDIEQTHQENIRHLRESLVAQIEKNDALTRDFQGRVVQLEYDLVVARRKLQEAEDENSTVKNNKTEKEEHQIETTKDEKSMTLLNLEPSASSTFNDEKIKILEAKLLDAQRKGDAMQRKAAEALQKSTLRETAIQQDLEFVRKELLETRKRLIEAQKPIDHQLEDQLKKTVIFERVNHTSWGNFLTNAMGSIDRCGVRVGRFFANHAMIRFFFLVYVIILHIYIFHLFTAVLHHMETTADDVHEHLEKLHQQHGAAHP